jgi:cell division protein FtsQ
MARERSTTGLIDYGSTADGAANRRRGPWKAAIFVLAAVVIIAVAVWGVLGSSLLVVRSVVVHTGAAPGATAVPRAEVVSAAHVAPGTPLARVNTAAVARRVEGITQVLSAKVSRDWPDTLVITITGRTPALAVPAAGGGFTLVDRFGVTVGQVTRRPPGIAVLAAAPPAATLRGSPAVYAAATVLRQLPPRIARRVLSVAAPSAQAVTLHLRGGVTVLWGGADRPREKAAELKILMRTKARSYDISDPATAVTGG